MSRSLIENYAWLVGERIFRLIVGLAVSTAVARHLGPNSYGELTYTLTYIAVFTTIANLGLDTAVIRNIVQDENATDAILNTAAGLRLLTGIALYFVALACGVLEYGNSDAFRVLLPIAALAIVLQSGDTLDLKFQAQSKNRISALSKIAGYSSANVVKILLIIYDMGLGWFAATIAIESALNILFLARLFASTNKPSKPFKLRMDIAKTLIMEGIPFLLSAVAIMIYMRIDQFFVNAYLGKTAVGIYAAASLIASLPQMLPTTLTTTLLPRFSKISHENPDQYYRKLYTAFRVFAAFGYISCAFLIITSQLLIVHLYGEEYQSAADVLAVLAISSIFIAIGVAQNIWIATERMGMLGLYKALMGATTAIMGNLYMASNYDLETVAYIAVLSQAVSAFLSNILFSRRVFAMQLAALLLIDLSRPLEDLNFFKRIVREK